MNPIVLAIERPDETVMVGILAQIIPDLGVEGKKYRTVQVRDVFYCNYFHIWLLGNST
jgi:hypothetical protein